MHDTHSRLNDEQWGVPHSPPLSAHGQVRRREILAEMERVSRGRQVRARTVRLAAVFAACCSATVLSWFALTPHSTRPGSDFVINPTTDPMPDSLPPPPLSNSVPRPAEAVVVAQYFGTDRGIADRLSSSPALQRRVIAQRLTGGELTRVLAEQTSFGLAEVQGRVLVLDNQASTESPVVIR